MKNPNTAYQLEFEVKSRKTVFRNVQLSLKQLLGKEYADAVCSAREFLHPSESPRGYESLASRKVSFYPKELQQRQLELLPCIGQSCLEKIKKSASGATTRAFRANEKPESAPVSTMGYLRVSENGRLFLITKCEHYHAPLGHDFPGYRLIQYAQELGVPNATHNNTRGHITRLLEEELIRTAAGLPRDDRARFGKVLASKRATTLNCVLNLDTGSLAAEAAVKMVLARFHKPQPDSPAPKYSGKTPVLVVVGDDDGGLAANYHGTTLITQILRGMWPGIGEGLEKSGVMLVRCVRPNKMDDLEAVFSRYEKGKYKIAGFFHELVLMNYGAVRLTDKFIRRAYTLCGKHDVPTVVDEIQSCVWSPELYMFREYGIRPTFVAVGKGFPGGEYAASRILFSAAMDSLPQFGALVTNGQEELASLAYLITMRWAEANAGITSAIGEYYEERLRELASKYSNLITSIEGRRHLAGIYFHGLEPGKAFAKHMIESGLDISVQTYKASCPPSALTKLPLTAGYEVIDFTIDRMNEALKGI